MRIRCPFLILLILALGIFRSHAQSPGFSKELRFAQYLEDKDALKEAIWVLEHIDTSGLQPAQKDSLFYMLGWAAYSAKQLDKSTSNLLQVQEASPKYDKSRFFAAYNDAYLGYRDTAIKILKRLSLPDTIKNELRALQLAGIALLRRDYAGFRSYSGQFTYSSYVFSGEEQRMQAYYEKLRRFKHRSPVLAGVYSALVPGLGKFYAGKKKQGVAAFLPVVSLAALTYEAWRKDGVRSARFIGFGALFSVFYIGNIWGSTLAVRIRANEFNKEYDNKILFDMHIPLRNFLIEASHVRAQSEPALAHRADSLFKAGLYFEASIAYERILFESDNRQGQYAALTGKLQCLKEQGLFDQAISLLEAWQSYPFPDSSMQALHSQQAICSYLGGHFENVLSLVDRWPYQHAGKEAPPLLRVLKILSLDELQRWSEAAPLYHDFMRSFQSSPDLYAHLPRLKSVTKAQWLATFIPGGGQFYAGKPGEALFSILVQAAGIYFGVLSFEQHYYVSAWLVGAALFGAFHMGGVRRSEILVQRYNRKKAQEFNTQVKEQLLQMLNKKGAG